MSMLCVAADRKRIKQIRQASGMTQLELAIAAGVAERTVRNAETGKRVRKDFLEYLAIALGVGLVDVVDSLQQLRVSERLVDRVVSALLVFFEFGDFSEFRSLMAPNMELIQTGPSEVPFFGHFRGADEVEKLQRDVLHHLLQFRTELPQLEVMTAGTEFICLYGIDSGLGIPNGKVCDTYRIVITCELERDRIVRYRRIGETHQIVEAYGL